MPYLWTPNTFLERLTMHNCLVIWLVTKKWSSGQSDYITHPLQATQETVLSLKFAAKSMPLVKYTTQKCTQGEFPTQGYYQPWLGSLLTFIATATTVNMANLQTGLNAKTSQTLVNTQISTLTSRVRTWFSQYRYNIVHILIMWEQGYMYSSSRWESVLRLFLRFSSLSLFSFYLLYLLHVAINLFRLKKLYTCAREWEWDTDLRSLPLCSPTSRGFPLSITASSMLLLPDCTTSRRALIARMMVSSRVFTASGE